MKRETYILYAKDFPDIWVAKIEDELYVSLDDVRKHFGLTDLGKIQSEIPLVTVRCEIEDKKKKRKRLEFVDLKTFEILFKKYANTARANAFFEEVMHHKHEMDRNVDGLTANDLRTKEDIEALLEERNTFITRNLSLEAEKRHLAPYIKIVKGVYGTKITPVLFEHVNDQLKYSKKIPPSKIAEDLRGAGIFDSDNLPKKSFIDKGCFKILVLSESKLAKVKTIQSVLVLANGIKEIERVIDNKYGGKFK